MNNYLVLKRPVITEKGTLLQEQNKYLFEVAPSASKAQVHEAVERAFNVKVISVNMVKMRGERRRMGVRWVQTPSWKKAVVTLKPGDKIQLFEGS